MQCPYCGNRLLDGFRFCHHCGKAVLSSAPAEEPTPEPAAVLPEPLPEPPDTVVPEEPEPQPENPILSSDQNAPYESFIPFEPFEPPIVPAEETPAAGSGEPAPFITDRRLLLLELLCYVPVVNIIVLAVLAASGKSPLRAKMAQMKLLAMMVVLLILLMAAMTVIVLMYLEIIPPIHLGRWGN